MTLAPWLKLLALLSDLVAIFRSWREREAGRAEAILEQKAQNDDAIRKAADARHAARSRDSDPDRLRETDGFRRD